MPEKRSSSC